MCVYIYIYTHFSWQYSESKKTSLNIYAYIKVHHKGLEQREREQMNIFFRNLFELHFL